LRAVVLREGEQASDSWNDNAKDVSAKVQVLKDVKPMDDRDFDWARMRHFSKEFQHIHDPILNPQMIPHVVNGAR
jgi:hypothetical protein